MLPAVRAPYKLFLPHKRPLKAASLSLFFFCVCVRAWDFVVAPRQALVEEFSPELTAKKGKLDSDPHLWMPVSHKVPAIG